MICKIIFLESTFLFSAHLFLANTYSAFSNFGLIYSTFFTFGLMLRYPKSVSYLKSNMSLYQNVYVDLMRLAKTQNFGLDATHQGDSKDPRTSLVFQNFRQISRFLSRI